RFLQRVIVANSARRDGGGRFELGRRCHRKEKMGKPGSGQCLAVPAALTFFICLVTRHPAVDMTAPRDFALSLHAARACGLDGVMTQEETCPSMKSDLGSPQSSV